MRASRKSLRDRFHSSLIPTTRGNPGPDNSRLNRVYLLLFISIGERPVYRSRATPSPSSSSRYSFFSPPLCHFQPVLLYDEMQFALFAVGTLAVSRNSRALGRNYFHILLSLSYQHLFLSLLKVLPPWRRTTSPRSRILLISKAKYSKLLLCTIVTF